MMDIGLIGFVTIAPLCWIRKLQTLNWTHILADLLIVASLITIISFSIIRVADEGWGSGI
jgi:hypothetical protein